MLIFQFTLPREERRQVQAQPLTLQNFNPRSHERSDHITQSFVFRFFNFNPRSHERSDFTGDYTFEVTLISIHAPTRGATMGDGYQEVQEVISIHAPTRGATSLKATEYKLSIDFNPRSHERSDNYIPDEFKSYIISIHAPTRGATMTSDETGMVAIFQSTLPREERRQICTINI